MKTNDRNFRIRKFSLTGGGTRDRLALSPSFPIDFRQKGRHAPIVGSAAESNLKKYEEAIGALLSRLSFVREREREKIANEIHDHVGQNLALAKMKLAALKSHLPDNHLIAIEEIGNLLDDAIKDTRSLIHELEPQVPQELGLKAALGFLAEQIQVKYGLPCLVEIASLPRSLTQEAQVVIFQVVRELLINSAKHARATRAEVACVCQDGFLRIEVLDDGQGFDRGDGTVPQPDVGKFGLFSIRARLAPLGGYMDIDSRIGAGTRVMISVPLAAN